MTLRLQVLKDGISNISPSFYESKVYSAHKTQRPESAFDRSARVSDFQASIAIFSLSLVARCSLSWWLHPYGPENVEPSNVAIALATTGHFSNPFQMAATGLTAHVAPVYPFLLSLLYRGVGSAGFSVAKHLFAIFLVSLQYAFLPYAVRLLSLPRVTGILGGFTAALLPRASLETEGGQEAVLAGLACLILVSLTVAHFRRDDADLLRGLGPGIGWGVMFLISPVFIVVLAGLLLVLPHRLRSSALIIFCSLLVISPWIIRNYLVLGHFVPVRDNLGLELSVSNNDRATALLERNFRIRDYRHPYSNLSETFQMKALGETAYYRLRQHEAFEWIGEHPRRFLQLTAEHIVFFWFNPLGEIVNHVFIVLLTLGGVTGLCLLYVRDRKTAWIFAVLWLSLQIPYYFTQVSPRYRFPIDWSFWLLCAYALWRLFPSAFRRFETPESSDS